MTRKRVRKLNKTSRTSFAVLLPPVWIRELGWRGKQKLTLTKRGKKITIEDWKPKQRKKSKVKSLK